MRKLVLYAIGLIVLCLCVVGCAPGSTPTPIVEQSIRVSISAADNQTQMIKGEETTFYIEIDPPSLKGQVADVNVFGDKGIQCEQSEGDMWTWYCTGTQETKAATVFAEITGTFPDQTARYAVAVVAPTPTPTDTGTPTPTELPVTETPTPTDTPTSLPTESSVTDTPTTPDVVAILIDQPPAIDGDLDEAVWSQARPLTYAVHPLVNDRTTVVVRLLWNNKYLYAGFDVSDTQVESSANHEKWNSDSVSVIIENGGRIQEYRYSLSFDPNDMHRLDPDRVGTTASKSSFKETTTLNDPRHQDEGYTVEMRIPWEGETPPVAGNTIAVDLLSVDHDYNPGEKYDHPDTTFSKISWDGDQDIRTAEKSMLLSTSTEAPVTDTPTPTDTPIPPPTEAPVTDTPTPSPPPTPTPGDCQSFRPRLSGAADFAGEVEILTPNNCTTGLPTETSIPVYGTYEGIPGDVDIWVLVYPPNLVYYVQSPNACEGATMSWGDGKWQVPVYLGERDGDPEWFDIVVVLTDQEASQFLSDWVRQCCQSGHYEGIPAARLEQMNITEKNYITVQTRD